MEQAKWFERKFTLTEDNALLPAIIERLEGTRLRIEAKINELSEEVLTRKIEGKWSITEEIGHLTDLEPLWLGRIEDILNGQTEMRATDLQNQKTHQAKHNQVNKKILIANFGVQRAKLLEKLETLKVEDLEKTALHPRMKTPMRIVDLAYFVAEHDDHHLAKMTALKKSK